MDLIYKNGYCNLAASTATDDSEGLFYNRDPLLVLPRMYQLSNGGQSYIVTATMQHEGLFKALDRQPLNRRAWACQERLLARRNISFTRDMVYFECAKELGCELVDTSHVIVRNANHSSLFQELGFRFGCLKNTQVKMLVTLKTLTPQIAPVVWRSVVEFYSTGQLTVPGDKLAALSGLARAIHNITGSGYLAGLWTERLELGMLWSVASTQPFPVTRRPDYRAPSWSWAALDSKISYYHLDRISHSTGWWSMVDLIDNSATPTGNDIFGRIRHASIRLSAWLFPLMASPKYRASRPDPKPGQMKRWKDLEAVSMSLADATAAYRTAWPEPDLRFSYDPETGVLHEAPFSECYALPLIAYTDERRRHCMLCLVLVAVTPSYGLYQRIGIMHIRQDVMSLPDILNSQELADLDGIESLFPVDRGAEYYHMIFMLVSFFGLAAVPSHERSRSGRHIITLV
jgi:hypothetical protein